MRIERNGTAPARSATLLLAVSLLVVVFTGCGASYTETGLDYMVRGNHAIALEYLDAGHRKHGGAENRRALLRVYQIMVRDLQREIDVMKRQKQAMRALTRVTLLEELTRQGESLKMPGANPKQLVKEARALQTLAQEQLDDELARRMGRGQYLRSDLTVCRQLLALQTAQAGSITRRCERLRERFKYYATIRFEEGSYPLSETWLGEIVSAFHRRHPELIAFVRQTNERSNARLIITVGQPTFEDTGWQLTRRSYHRKAVRIRDKKGRLVRETVRVPPTQAQINLAKKLGKPAPQARMVAKQLYRQVSGELRKYSRSVSGGLPIILTLERDTADGLRIPVAFTENVSETVAATYQSYQGARLADPRTRADRRKTRAQAERLLPSSAQLLVRLRSRLPDRIARGVLDRVE